MDPNSEPGTTANDAPLAGIPATRRRRLLLVIGLAVAAGAAVGGAVLLAADDGGTAASQPSEPLRGAPPLLLDLPDQRAHVSPQKLLAAAERELPKGDVRIEVARAIAAYEEDPDAALARLRDLPQEEAVVAFHLGLAELWSGDRLQAVEDLDRAARLDPFGLYGTAAENTLYPAQVRGYPPYFPPRTFGRGSVEELRKAAERQPGSSDRWLALAAKLQAGDRGGAIDAATRAVEADPTGISPRVALGVLSFDKANPAASFGRLGPMLQQAQDSSEIRFHIALLSLWIGLDERALGEFRQVRDADPDGPYTIYATEFVRQLEQRLGQAGS